MSLHTGTITDAAPEAAFSTLLKSLVGGAGVQNWSFIENIPAGTGANQSGSASFSVDVFKCAGSGADANDAALDFYVGIPIGYSTTVLYLLFAESYNPTNKLFSGCVHNYTGRTGYMNVLANGYCTYGTFNGSDERNAASIVGAGAHAQLTINTTGFDYWLELNNNFLLLGIKAGATQKSIYWGLMDSLVDDSIGDSKPLVMWGNGVSISYASGSFIHLPGIGEKTGEGGTYGAKLAGWTNDANLAVTNQAGYQDLWAADGVWVSRCMMYHGSDFNYSKTQGNVRGLLKEEVLCFYYGGTVNIGDTMVIDDGDATPDTWVVMSNASTDNHYLIVRQ